MSTAPTRSAADRRQSWHEARLRRLAGTRGPLSVTGTHWLTEQLTLPGVPGTWQVLADQPSSATLSAHVVDGLVVDGDPLEGTVTIRSDAHPDGPSDIVVGQVGLLLIERDGALAVRVFDPAAVSASGFAGVETFRYDQRWVLPARFEPYPARREVPVPNADGVTRPLGLGGVVHVEIGGAPRRIAVEVTSDDGSLQAVLADSTSGTTSYRFRFLVLPPPGQGGGTVADLNRLYLPPCAFSDHFVCPFPPPGNTLDVAVEAGERLPRWSAADHR